MNQECTDIETIARLTVERDRLRAALGNIRDFWIIDTEITDIDKLHYCMSEARAALASAGDNMDIDIIQWVGNRTHEPLA